MKQHPDLHDTRPIASAASGSRGEPVGPQWLETFTVAIDVLVAPATLALTCALRPQDS